MNKKSKIFVAGHLGMVGSAITRYLKGKGFENIIVKSRAELDLLDQSAVHKFLLDERPSQVYLAAAKVGGIHANNNYPGEFIYENMTVQGNVINGSFEAGVKKLVFLGSSCIYPKLSDQPIVEESLLTGKLEETNEPYAIAKIAGIKLCESYNRQYGASHGLDFRSVMPTNLYGPGDNYHPENSHVIPALIAKFHNAKEKGLPEVVIWGSGSALREFLHVDDLAIAAVHCMNLDNDLFEQITTPMCSHLNVGAGSDISIRELALLIGDVVGYSGKICFDYTKPDGTPRKLMDSSKIISTGWRPQIDLRSGLRATYEHFNIQSTIRGL
jgi:GDP-L-fucose synthase